MSKKKIEKVELEGAHDFDRLLRVLERQGGLKRTLTPRGIELVPPSIYYAMIRHVRAFKVRKVLETRNLSLNMGGNPLGEVINFLRDVSGLNFVLIPGVDGDLSVTLNAQNKRLDRILADLCRRHRLRYEIRGSIIYILPKEKR